MQTLNYVVFLTISLVTISQTLAKHYDVDDALTFFIPRGNAFRQQQMAARAAGAEAGGSGSGRGALTNLNANDLQS